MFPSWKNKRGKKTTLSTPAVEDQQDMEQSRLLLFVGLFSDREKGGHTSFWSNSEKSSDILCLVIGENFLHFEIIVLIISFFTTVSQWRGTPSLFLSIVRGISPRFKIIVKTNSLFQPYKIMKKRDPHPHSFEWEGVITCFEIIVSKTTGPFTSVSFSHNIQGVTPKLSSYIHCSLLRHLQHFAAGHWTKFFLVFV